MPLKETLQAAGFTPRPYSDRGMFGRQCLGVTAATTQAVFAAGLTPAQINNASVDSLDQGVIVYWQSVAWTEG